MGTNVTIGYARASALDQKAELQLDALKAGVSAKVFVEKASGSKENRPQLIAAPDYLRAGNPARPRGAPPAPAADVPGAASDRGPVHGTVWVKSLEVPQRTRPPPSSIRWDKAVGKGIVGLDF